MTAPSKSPAAKPRRPLVSFIVPTLNRGRYVVRAVESCLAVDPIGLAIEVVVLDSQSDDGSFEALTERFRSDPRVKLLQNKRGLGPTHSWSDGARAAGGDFLTFVWSDDYIAPDFVALLAPSLGDGRAVAYGHGAIRDVDDESPLPSDPRRERFPPQVLLGDYFDLGRRVWLGLPVSPCCSLFTREAFDAWLAAVEPWARATPLRELLIWRRAIGPDLMLFFQALLLSTTDVVRHRAATAQFSSHPGSITIASHRWPYQTGYWLARLWALSGVVDRDQFVRLAAQTMVFGWELWLKTWIFGDGGVPDARGAVVTELRSLTAEARRRGVAGRVLLALPEALVAQMFWRAASLGVRIAALGRRFDSVPFPR